MNQQVQARMNGERYAALSLRQLMCGVFIWRTMMTSLLPLCGSATWWVALVGLLPGVAVAWLFRWTMQLTGAATVTDAVRACMGRVGGAAFSILLASLLLVEGLTTLTTLLTVFTQGVGTRGTQFTLAVLTGVVLLCCLHREGLPRAVYLLRWGMLVLVIIVAYALTKVVELSNLYPLYGTGTERVSTAMVKGMSLGWPFLLMLTVPSCKKRGRLGSGALSVMLALGLVLLTVLTMPHECIVQQKSVANGLLLPVWYQSNAVRVAGLCLLMLCFFMALGGAVQIASECLTAPFSRAMGWFAYVLLAVLVMIQALDITTLWAILQQMQPWLLLPLAVLALMMLPIVYFRRKAA